MQFFDDRGQPPLAGAEVVLGVEKIQALEMADALAVVFGGAGEPFNPRFTSEPGGGGATAIGAKAIGVADLRLLARPGLVPAPFGLGDRVDERLDFTQGIGIDAREA